MKLTGKLFDEGLSAFTQKPALINGRQTPRLWVLVADSNLARFYKKTGSQIELIGEAEPAQASIEAEINNKTMGRMVSAAGSTVYHKFEPHMEEARQDEIQFSRQISNFLEEAEAADTFDRLIVIAAPRTLGDLRSNFNKPLKSRIVAEVDKDLTKLKDKDLEQALEKIIWF
jgi:protein required for attachment to host cells